MNERIASITLDDGGKRRSLEAEHEMSVAMADLLGENLFKPEQMGSGPYNVTLRIEDGRLVFDMAGGGKKGKVMLSVQPLKHIIKDYFLICESYYAAIKASGRGKIEAIDMARRGIHNEGADKLQELLAGKITIDKQTSRRLFTLICVLHIK
jgi:uncharacterized protein (UPF0262 family)